MEVNTSELRENKSYLTRYLGKTFAILIGIALTMAYFLSFPIQDSFILALGIATPSAGFIINSLKNFNLQNDQEYWIKSKAISKEIISIILLFVAMQGDSIEKFVTSTVFLALLLFLLPYTFKFFFRFISPHAPNSEVPLLVALSLISGVLSKEIGAYYLLGAFAVGIIGSRFKKDIFKKDEETLFDAISNFFIIFLPFYFFYAGLNVRVEFFSLGAFLIALVLFIIFVPIRMGLIQWSIRSIRKEKVAENMDISISLMPTLIFGLVITGILIERNKLPQEFTYALLIYTLLTSVLPVFVKVFLRKGLKGETG